MTRIRVALFLRNRLLLDACAECVRSETDLKLVNARVVELSTFRSVRNFACDIAVFEMDLSTEELIDSIETVHAKRPRMKSILFSPRPPDLLLAKAMELGVRGYLTASSRLQDLVDGIREVAGGGCTICRTLRDRLTIDTASGSIRHAQPELIPDLSDDELDVIRLLAFGLSTDEMGEVLERSKKGIESLKYRIMKRLDIHDRVEMTRFAIREGLLRI
jgi:DNA-binding NarL/FixJ family response regulator